MMSRRVLLHIGFWLAYMLSESYLQAEMFGQPFRDKPFFLRFWKGLESQMLITPLIIMVVYVLFYYFIPRFQQYRKDTRFFVELGLFIVSSLFLYRVMVAGVIYPIVYSKTSWENQFALWRLLWAFLDIYAIAGIAVAIKLIRLRYAQKEKELLLVQEKLESELNFLRAQTNPHFLFNTLNNIYGLARRKSELTPEAVLKLSKLMRYMIYECDTDSVPINNEVKIIRDYIDLEKLRYDERLQVNFNVNIDDPNKQIAPLILLPFVENSFKHGVSIERNEAKIDIDLSLEKNDVNFKIKNSKSPDKPTHVPGKGLANVRRLLELTYPQNHELIIEESDCSYAVQLKIKIKEDEVVAVHNY